MDKGLQWGILGSINKGLNSECKGGGKTNHKNKKNEKGRGRSKTNHQKEKGREGEGEGEKHAIKKKRDRGKKNDKKIGQMNLHIQPLFLK
jgi:hypothetical protein